MAEASRSPTPVRCRCDGGSRWVDPMEEEALIYTQESKLDFETLKVKRKRELTRDDLVQEVTHVMDATTNQDNWFVPHELRMNKGKKEAKTRLLEICASKCWKTPSFLSVEEEDINSKKSFTCKVTVEVDTITMTLLECFSEPKPQKEAAEEHAAEGALWYLKHLEIT